MAGKKTGKRLLTWVLVLVMALSLLPLNALAGENDVSENPVPEGTELAEGDTYTLDTDDASKLPKAPEGLRWDGPESIKGDQIICGKNEHQHDSDCYQWEWFLIFYRKLVCNQEEHIHSDYCYNHTYKWTLVKEGDITTSNTWRRWWPVYWTLSKSGRIDANDAIESVTAGKNVAYTNSALDSAEALAGTTATLGDAVDAGGFTITTKPGYYVKAARVICGNYNRCGVSNNLVPTEQTEGNYSNTIDIRFDQGNNDLNFDHLSANGNDVNLPKDYPTSRPTGNDYHNVLRVGSTKNTLYPYYFLIQVAQDPTTYSVSYDWGDRELSNSVPKGETNLKRNESYEVSKPSKEAIAEAAEKNLAFAGWKYNDSDRICQVGESFSVSEDVNLTAQWTQLYTVSYELAGGSWKAGEAVENDNYPENVSVSVTNNEPEKSGYEFIDWTPSTDNDNVDDPVISKGKFTMPAANVTLTAQWKLIEAADLSVEKTVTKVGETTVAAGNNTIPTAYPGDEIEWTITVTNSGNAEGNFTLIDVLKGRTDKLTVSPAMAEGANSYTIAPKNPTTGEPTTMTFTVTYTVKASDVTDNGLVNTVTMNGTSKESALVPTAQKYTVTGTIDNGGTVTESPQTVNHNGSSKAMTFTPAPGYEIASVKVKTGNDMEPVTDFNKQSYTYAAQENVTADITVTVETTKRTDLSYTVNYLEKDTNDVLHTAKTVENQTFGNTIKSANEKIDIVGYNYVSATPASLTIGTGKNVINIYYTKRSDLSYTVNYLEKDTDNVLHTAKTVENQTFGDTVKSADEKIDIVGYNYANADKETLTIGTGENVINLYYTKRTDLSYTVHYYLKNTTKKVADDKTVNGQTFNADVTEKAIRISGYRVYGDSVKSITIGTGTNEIIFYYTRASRPSASSTSKPTLNTGDHYAYVMGYPDGTVRPNGSITRAEVSAILFRLLSDETRDEYFTTESSFTDVKAGAWYNNSIATLEKAGVIVDTAKGGAFRPNEAITRAELAAMLAQFSDAKPVKGVKFSDVSAEHWAYEAIAIAAKMGWIEGYPDGTFRPDATITRAEMMTLVNRALERVPSDEDHLLSKRVMLTFPDCKSGDWFYIAVQEATNSHTYERAATEKNGDEQWTALRANRDWTQLEK